MVVVSQSERVKCSLDDTIGDLKKLIAAQTGADPTKITLKKWQESTVTLRPYDANRISPIFPGIPHTKTTLRWEIRDL